MKFALYSIAIVAVTIPSMTEAVPIDAMVDADGQESWFGNIKRSFIPLDTYCQRKLGVEAKALADDAIELSEIYVQSGPEIWKAKFRAHKTHALYLKKQ